MGLDIPSDVEVARKRLAWASALHIEASSDEEKARYLNELIPFEKRFATSQEDVGLVASMPYNLHEEIMAGYKPKVAKPIRYPNKAREWLQDYI